MTPRLRLGLPVEHWHRLRATSNDDAWSPGYTLLRDAREFQAVVRALEGLWIFAGREPSEIEIPNGAHYETAPYYDWREARTRAIRKAPDRTPDEWYTLAHQAAHVAREWGLVE